MVNNKFAYYVQEFLTSYLENECNYSKNTIVSYSTTFLLFLKFMKEEKNIVSNKIEIELITSDIITQFLGWIETERKDSIPTRNQRLACLKSFFKYVQAKEPSLLNNITSILSITKKKAPGKMISYFTEKEVELIINHLNEINDLKRLTMFCVLFETGARVSEFINIKISDLSLNESAHVIINGKGNKTRIVPISQELVKLIRKYLNEVYVDYGEGYLFYSTHRKRYARSSINRQIDKLANEMRIKYPEFFKGKYSPHKIRHSKATQLCNNGTGILDVQGFLGHSSIESTKIYLKPDLKKQREEILKNSKDIKTKNRYSKRQQEDLDEWLKNNMK